jgi:hypothetical protein
MSFMCSVMLTTPFQSSILEFSLMSPRIQDVCYRLLIFNIVSQNPSHILIQGTSLRPSAIEFEEILNRWKFVKSTKDKYAIF